MSATAFNAMRRRRAATERAAKETADKAAAAVEKPLDKMTLAELDVKAAELGVVFPDDVKLKADRAAFLVETIEAAKKEEE